MTSIGRRIRFYGGRNKLTAREMAARMDVSPSTISKIENDKIKPSMEMLQRIAEVINVPVGELFIEGEIENIPALSTYAQVSVVRKNERRKLILYNSDIEYMLLIPSFFHGRSELAMMELEKGQNSGVPKRHPFGEEFILVLEGSLTIQINSDAFILGPGDSITFDATIAHSYGNLSNGKTVIISGNTPPVF